MASTHLRRPRESRSNSGSLRLLPAMAVGCIASVAAAGGPVGAGETTLHPIVTAGEHVPGQPKGVVFHDFATLELAHDATNGPFDAFARIDGEGNVAFHAYIGNTPPDSGLAPSGYFKMVDGQIETLGLIDGPAPGTSSNFLPPIFSPITPRIENGLTTFTAPFGSNAFNADIGMWHDVDGSIEALALEGDHVIGMPAGGGLDVLMGSRLAGGNVYFFGEIAGISSTDSPPEGFWRRLPDGTIEPIAVSEMQAPLLPPGVVFGESTSIIASGAVGAFGLNSNGRYALVGFTKGPGITLTNDEAIWIETASGLNLLLREGDPVPTNHFPDGSNFSSGSVGQGAFAGEAIPPIRINDNEEVVFFAQVDVPGDPPRVPTLWSTRSGQLELVLRGEQFGVKFSEPGDPAPGVPDGTFTAPLLTDLNEQGDIMILALAENDPDIFTDFFGVWIDRGNGIELVGVEEGPVPDHPGLTFIPETNGVRGIQRAWLNPDGSVLFTGLFFNDRNELIEGAFVQTPDGEAHSLFKTGGTVEIAEPSGSVKKTIDIFRFGEGVADDGHRVAELFFADGTTGLFRVDVVDNQPLPGDVDGNGTVDVFDLLDLLAEWGACSNPDDCPADIDGDGMVNVFDLLELLANWGSA